MKTAITAIAAILLVTSAASFAHAEVPTWVKNNAGWWAEGSIDDGSFVQGIQFLIKEGIMSIPPTAQGASTGSNEIPTWVKNNAGWWAEGSIDDDSFVQGIQFLIKEGVMKILPEQASDVAKAATEMASSKKESSSSDSKMAEFEAELEKCSEIKKAYQRLDCEKIIKKDMLLYQYKQTAQQIPVGPVIYYWQGMGTEGSEFEISPTGQAILSIRMLAENTGTNVVSLNCTSPQICNYDVWDGSKAFKYSGMDFTNGAIVINPGDSREFNILFGPNIGYGGTQFLYDPAKDYTFRITEPFGKANVAIDLD